MGEEIKKVLDKFDKVLENYELDKKWGQMSVDSICHLFPNEMIIIKDYITDLQEENKRIFSKVNDDELLISNAMNYAEAQDYKSRCEKANWWLKEMLKQARSDETKAVINGTLELLLNGGENNVKD